MKTLHYIVSRFAIWIVPILLVIFSLSTNLTNASLHKNTLKNGNFYNQLSNELQSSELETKDIKKGFSTILISSVIKDLASPGWLQNLFEKNIDGTTKWLSGETSDLGIYAPSKEIETTIAKSLDDKVSQVKTDFGGDIPTCNIDQSLSIKRQGFSLNDQFCLPEEVKSGNQKLTEFMSLTDKDTQNSEFLDKLIANNNLNPFSDTINVKELPSTNPIKSVFFDSLNRVRGAFIYLTNIRLYLLISILVLFCLSILTAKLADRKILKDIKRFLVRTAIGTIILVALIILSLGGTVYLTSFAQNLLLPGVASSQLVNLLTFEIVKFVFNVFSIAVFFAIGFLAIFGIISLLEQLGILNKFVKTNKKIQETPKPEAKTNVTFDGQFQNVLLDKIETDTSRNNFNQQSNPVNYQNINLESNATEPQNQPTEINDKPEFVTPNQEPKIVNPEPGVVNPTIITSNPATPNPSTKIPGL